MSANQVDKNFVIPSSIKKEGIRLYPANEPPFSLHGVWYDTDRYYRLPREVAVTVSRNVTQKCDQTAGGRVRFMTDSPYVAVKLTLHNVEQIAMMTVVGTMGLDVYADGVFAGSFRPPFRQVAGDFESVVELGEPKMRELTIHFPLYSGVFDLYVGVDGEATVAPAKPYKHPCPILYYGSSITNGGCCSRPGMTYEAQLSRMLDADHRNLGFGGSAKAEREIAEYIAAQEMSVFVYDYDHNAPSVEYLAETHARMFRTVREKNPSLPIIMISRPQVVTKNNRDERFAVIKKTYDDAVAVGDRNVYLVHGASFFDGVGNDYTVDGTHPTDLGFYRMAVGLEPLLRAILEK